MQFEDYVVSEKTQVFDSVYVIKLKPKNGSKVLQFVPGQFCQIKNPKCDRPNEARSFSIASSPNTTDYLEFCFKTYGPWSHALGALVVGDTVQLMGPLGRFTWDTNYPYAVFLPGGVGITPMMSMIRFITEQHIQTSISLIYGNRAQGQIAYEMEIGQLIAKIPNSKVVDVLSDEPENSNWQGYRGFITAEILQREVDFAKNPTFFLCGPPVFVGLMRDLLKSMGIELNRVKFEIYSSPPPPKTAQPAQAVPIQSLGQRYVTDHPDWTIQDNLLVKQFTLPTFMAAIGFVNEVAKLAQATNHHPDILVAYNKVSIGLISHDAGNAITEKDTTLASAIDAITKLR